MTYFTAIGSFAVPTSFITKGKQRLKQNIDTVYLKNGDEFEIELFNPTQNKILAKIEVNGNNIGNGVILRPGERVYLERHLGESKKFLFETYNVESNNIEVGLALVNNGNVTVKFYNENFNQNNLTTLVNTGTYSTYGSPPWTILSNTSSGTYVPSFTTTTSSATNVNFTNTGMINTAFSNNTLQGVTTSGVLKNAETIFETGRIEKGSNSNQRFDYDNSTTFQTTPTKTNWWKIKPISEKLLTKSDLITYCPECGSKRKKDSHKFCPSCGTKF